MTETTTRTPQRIQLRRVKGWRMPSGAVRVARPSRWGNPFTIAHFGREEAVRRYRELFDAPGLIDEARADLAGRDLACWCPIVDAAGNRVPCHADVLLELVNDEAR